MDTKTNPTALGYLKILGEFLNSGTNMGNQFFCRERNSNPMLNRTNCFALLEIWSLMSVPLEDATDNGI